MSCPQIWEIDEESRRRASEAQLEKERQRATAKGKKQRRNFWLEEEHENFVAAAAKVREVKRK